MVILILLAIISFVLIFVTENTTTKFYLLPYRFWELAIGSLICFIPKQKKSEIFAASGLIILLISVCMLSEEYNNISQLMLLPCFATGLLIVFAEGSFVAKLLSLKPLMWIGLISYSAYLIHQPLFAFARISSLDPLTSTHYLGLIIVTFSLSFVAWKFIENPFRKKNKISFRVIIIVSVLFMVVLKGGAMIIEYKKGFPKRFEMSEELETSFEWAGNSKIGKECFVYHDEGNSQTKPNFCTIGQEKSFSYFLTGNSFALALMPLFDSLQLSGFYASVGTGCHFLCTEDKEYIKTAKTPTAFYCNTLPVAVFEYIKQNDFIKDIMTIRY